MDLALVLGFLACFAVRGLALDYNWPLPAYKSRPDREHSSLQLAGT